MGYANRFSQTFGTVSLAVLALLFSNSIFADEFNINSLVSLIQSQHLTTIEQILPRLPASLTANYTLVYQSGSLQQADPLHPRAILYGADAKFILTFNGDPSKQGYNTLEVVQFNSADRAFEFYELTFPLSADIQNGRVPRKNPQTCVQCHREDLRPNWEGYQTWPGVYGSADDHFTSAEQVNFNRFLNVARSDPRYSALAAPQEQFTPTIDYGNEGPGAPNTRLTERLGLLNLQRFARLAQATPQYDEFKYALVGMFACSDSHSPLEFLPQGVMPTPNYVFATPDDYSQATAWLRYVFESRNIPVSSWFMNFSASTTNSFGLPDFVDDSIAGALVVGDSDLSSIVPLQSKQVLGVDVEMTSTPTTFEGATETTCQTLKIASLKALTGIPKLVPISAGPSPSGNSAAPPGTFGACIQCHDDKASSAPQIPFGDPSELPIVLLANQGFLSQQVLLRTAENATPDIKMPPNKDLSASERAEIQTYISAIGSGTNP